MLQGNGATTVAYPRIASTLAESCLDEFPLLRVHPMCLHSPGLSNLPHQNWPRAKCILQPVHYLRIIIPRISRRIPHSPLLHLFSGILHGK